MKRTIGVKEKAPICSVLFTSLLSMRKTILKSYYYLIVRGLPSLKIKNSSVWKPRTF